MHYFKRISGSLYFIQFAIFLVKQVVKDPAETAGSPLRYGESEPADQPFVLPLPTRPDRRCKGIH
jgi:hypothetical protein